MIASIKIYNFAEFKLNPAKRLLFNRTDEVKLRDRDFDVLLFLIESSPKICSHDEIIKAVWDVTVVENNSIEKAIANIRSALGDNARTPRFIRTVRAKGYLFIGDVQESREMSAEEVVSEIEPVQLEIVEKTQPLQGRNIGFRKLVLSFGLILFLGLIGLFWWKGNEILARYNATVIFADAFSNEDFDSNRWKIKGTTAQIEDGIAKITATKTDEEVRLQSALFSFDPNKALTINCRIKVSHSQNFKGKAFFNGYFGLIPKTGLLPLADAGIKNHYKFGVNYINYDYDTKYPNGEIDEFSTEGFFLVKDNGSPNKKIDYRDGKISKRIEPVWNEWFEQKLVYEPFSGKLSYFINDDLKDVINTGDLLKVMEENKLRLDISPSGWWVNHTIEIDYIEITQ